MSTREKLDLKQIKRLTGTLFSVELFDEEEMIFRGLVLRTS
jgi:hypothetical protein